MISESCLPISADAVDSDPPLSVAERRKQFAKHTTVPDLKVIMKERFGECCAQLPDVEETTTTAPRSCHRPNQPTIRNVTRFRISESEDEAEVHLPFDAQSPNIYRAQIKEYSNDIGTSYIELEEFDIKTGILQNTFLLPLHRAASAASSIKNNAARKPFNKGTLDSSENLSYDAVTTGENDNFDGGSSSCSNASTVPKLKNTSMHLEIDQEPPTLNRNNVSLLTSGTDSNAQQLSQARLSTTLISDYSTSSDSTSIMSDVSVLTDMSLIHLPSSSPLCHSATVSPLQTSAAANNETYSHHDHTSEHSSRHAHFEVSLENQRSVSSSTLSPSSYHKFGATTMVGDSISQHSLLTPEHCSIYTTESSDSMEEHINPRLIALKVNSDEFSDLEEDDFGESKSNTSEFQDTLNTRRERHDTTSPILAICRRNWRNRTNQSPNSPACASSIGVICSPDGRLQFRQQQVDRTFSSDDKRIEKFCGVRDGYVYRMGSHGKAYYEIDSHAGKKECGGYGSIYRHRPYSNRRRKRAMGPGSESKGCRCTIT